MNHETLGLTIEKLQYILLISIPFFAYIYGWNFLFFLPIVFFVIIGLGNVKREIVNNENDNVIVNSIFSIWRWTLFLWVFEMLIYWTIKTMISQGM